MRLHIGIGSSSVRGVLTSICALLLITGGACTTDDDEGRTPTAGPSELAAATATATVEAAPPDASAFAANSQVVTDFLCVAMVPVDWVDDGTGRGTTASGARFELFGGVIRGDADWERSVQAVSTPVAGPPIAGVEQTESSIRVTFAGGRGFEYRERFGDRYCDFRVESRSGEIPAGEQAIWAFITESLEPVQP